jgi:hypothetical protein
MERTYLKMARKYERADEKGRPWAMAMARTLRALVAEIEQRPLFRRSEIPAE